MTRKIEEPKYSDIFYKCKCLREKRKILFILPFPYTSTWSDSKFLSCIFRHFLCSLEVFYRLVLEISCEWKCPIVDTEHLVDLEFFLHLHTLTWTRMHRCHEPSRIIRTYGEKSYIETARELLPYFCTKRTDTSIPSKVDGFIGYLYGKTTPKCTISIGDTTSREVL